MGFAICSSTFKPGHRRKKRDLPRNPDCLIVFLRRARASGGELTVLVLPVAWTTPNIITLLRMGTAPVLVCILLYTGPVAAAMAAAVFFLATVSDFLDGYIARSYGSGSTLGKFLDPLADKVVVMTALIMLAGMARTPRVAAWMVAVMVIREVLVTGLRAIAAAEGLVIAAEELGKYKMTLQAIAIQGLLIHYTYFHIDFFAGGMFVLWIAMAVSVWSGADYYVKAIRALRPHRERVASKRAAR
jgi:CDP-diacylglycerol---glycerol-3-phosphate 3-phosphatidyltransferase